MEYWSRNCPAFCSASYGRSWRTVWVHCEQLSFVLSGLGTDNDKVSYAIFSIFVIPQAFAQNFATLVVARVISGGCAGILIVVLGGVIGDIWNGPEERSLPMNVYIWSYATGLSLGPVMAGVIIRYLHWRWYDPRPSFVFIGPTKCETGFCISKLSFISRHSRFSSSLSKRLVIPFFSWIELQSKTRPNRPRNGGLRPSPGKMQFSARSICSSVNGLSSRSLSGQPLAWAPCSCSHNRLVRSTRRCTHGPNHPLAWFNLQSHSAGFWECSRSSIRTRCTSLLVGEIPSLLDHPFPKPGFTSASWGA